VFKKLYRILKKMGCLFGVMRIFAIFAGRKRLWIEYLLIWMGHDGTYTGY